MNDGEKGVRLLLEFQPDKPYARVQMSKEVACRRLKELHRFRDTVENSRFAYWHQLTIDLWYVIFESYDLAERIYQLLSEDAEKG